MRPADPRVLGAVVTAEGTNFSLWAPAADAVELCLFNEVGGELTETRFSLAHRDGRGPEIRLSSLRTLAP
ncbi:MAG: hypothetical protein RL673_464 [Actinomycetota bacterium]